MKKTKKLFVIFLTLLMLSACNTISKGMSEGKRNGSDEFLVKKKAPLVLPPSYGELPEPGTKVKENIATVKESKLSIEEMMGQSFPTDTNNGNNELNKSIEQSIIEKINEQ
jgi:hypothetical protein|tara:strand:+ start:146 stop:478 length:333 start_codon:yes stop_codon:yes gene_type:complete